MLRVCVKTNTPRVISNIPTIRLKYFKKGPILRIRVKAWVENNPTSKKGKPNPREYVSSNKKLIPGLETAKANTDPKTAPTQGVHPTANAAPKTKEVT